MNYAWQTSRRTLTIGSRPLLMGVLNITPDSFSDGGRFLDPAAGLNHALQLQEDGADLIDIGGESTRPGATPVDAEEEWRRVGPVITALQGRLSIPLSIDTTKATVAARALDAGAEIVNDVSGGEWDPALWPLVVERRAGYVLMHCQGHPASMQQSPIYQDVRCEVHAYLRDRLHAITMAGLPPDHVVLDVGIGFGKTVEHNLTLLAKLDTLLDLGRPLLAGISRKSFLKRIGDTPHLTVSTVAAETFAGTRGAAVWRTHDVAAAAAAARMLEALQSVR